MQNERLFWGGGVVRGCYSYRERGRLADGSYSPVNVFRGMPYSGLVPVGRHRFHPARLANESWEVSAQIHVSVARAPAAAAPTCAAEVHNLIPADARVCLGCGCVNLRAS